MRPIPAAAALLGALVAAGCNQTTGTTGSIEAPPPDARAAILAHKIRLWKDPDSIKGASIAAPTRHIGSLWHVCVRLNARNSFGAYGGERDHILAVYDDGKPPEILSESGAWHCQEKAYAPFPELNGDYRPATAKR